MSADLGRMMMMAWIWVLLVILARLNTADDPHRDGRLAGLDALFLDTEPPPAETDSGERSFQVPVWKYVEGKTWLILNAV